MRGAALLPLLVLAACASGPPPQAAMTRGTVPRDSRGEAVLTAIPPPPAPEPPPPAEFKPVTQQQPAIDCSHLRHC